MSNRGVDEMNLAEFSISFITKDFNNLRSRIKTIRVLDSVNNFKSDRNGYRDGFVEIVTDGEFPKPFDEEVLLGILKFGSLTGFNSPEISFSRNELLKDLNISNGGQSYKRLSESIIRLSKVSMNSDAWYDVKLKRHVHLNAMKFYSDFNIGSYNNDNSKYSFIILGDELYRSLKNGYVIPIDLDIYFSFRFSLSGKIFRILNKIFPRIGNESFIFGFKEFVFDRLGFNPDMKWFNIRSRLNQSGEELIEKNIILKLSVFKLNGIDQVRFQKGGYFLNYEYFKNSTMIIKEHPLVPEFKYLGISDLKLISRILMIWSNEEEKLKAQISLIKWNLDTGKAKGTGYSVMALLEKWNLKNYKDPANIKTPGKWRIRGYHNELIFNFLEDAEEFCKMEGVDNSKIYQ